MLFKTGGGGGKMGDWASNQPPRPPSSHLWPDWGKPGSCAVALVGSADGAIAARPVEATLPPRSRGRRLISLARSAALRSPQRYGIDLQAASAAASRFANVGH